MNIQIFGRRFFRNIIPTKDNLTWNGEFRFSSFPKGIPYSWTIRNKDQNTKFDWKKQL